MICAKVVLPTPGGPHKIMEAGRPASIILRIMPFGPTRWSCPTYSSSVLGRKRSAKGFDITYYLSANLGYSLGIAVTGLLFFYDIKNLSTGWTLASDGQASLPGSLSAHITGNVGRAKMATR